MGAADGCSYAQSVAPDVHNVAPNPEWKQLLQRVVVAPRSLYVPVHDPAVRQRVLQQVNKLY